MDQLFVELIGKPQLNPAGKIITIVADNFSFLEDQAKFLKATFAIPAVKQLPLDHVTKRLIQIGSIHRELEDLLTTKDTTKSWIINKYHDSEDNDGSLCDNFENDTSKSSRSLIFINDASKFLLSTYDDANSQKRFLRLVDSWRRSQDHFVVLLFQNSNPTFAGTFLRDLEYISDACVHCKSYKNCYLQSIWFLPIPTHKTLIPPKVETNYYTCKIGKSYWSADLLCFYERVRVTKNHDPDICDKPLPSSNNDVAGKSSSSQDFNRSTDNESSDQRNNVQTRLESIHLALDSDDEGDRNESRPTLPYIRAQNPEQSRIFYYPDKDDDIDEDDPDNDLDI